MSEFARPGAQEPSPLPAYELLYQGSPGTSFTGVDRTWSGYRPSNICRFRDAVVIRAPRQQAAEDQNNHLDHLDDVFPDPWRGSYHGSFVPGAKARAFCIRAVLLKLKGKKKKKKKQQQQQK